MASPNFVSYRCTEINQFVPVFRHYTFQQFVEIAVRFVQRFNYDPTVLRCDFHRLTYPQLGSAQEIAGNPDRRLVADFSND